MNQLLTFFLNLERQNTFFQNIELLKDIDLVGNKSKYLQVVQRTKNGLLGTDGEMSRIHSVLYRRRWNAHIQIEIHIE